MSNSAEAVAREIVYNKIDFSWRHERIAAVLINEIKSALPSYAAEQVRSTWEEAIAIAENAEDPDWTIGVAENCERLRSQVIKEFSRRAQ